MPKSPDFKYNRDLHDVISDLRKSQKVPLLPETGWHKIGVSEDFEIPFQNSWGNAGATTAPASHYISEDGEVRKRGVVSGGASGTVMFVLPEEARPEFEEPFPVVTKDTDGNYGMGIVTVMPSGDVIFVGKAVVQSGSIVGAVSVDGGSP